MKIRSSGGLIAVLVGSLCACGDGFDLPEPARLEKLSAGDGQSATAGNRLSIPFSVQITAEDLSAVPREPVVWVITEGDGAVLSDSVTVTDGNGVAQVYLTLGPTAGTYVVSASLQRKLDAVVTFSAVAVSAPVITGTGQATFTGGDEISLQGSHFSDSTVVEIGGVVATMTTLSISGQGMSVIVPQCLLPGSVSITARVGLSTPIGITGTYEPSTAPLSLAPGEYLSIAPAALGGCATFPDAGADTVEYLLAPQSVSGSPGESVWFRLRGDAAVPAVAMAEPDVLDRPVSARFDDFLRAQEAELAALPRQPRSEGLLSEAAIQSDIQVGDTRTFRVCDKITCSEETDFASVQAEAKYVGEHALIYQDRQAPAGGLNETDFRELGSLFDDILYSVATRAFGSESDVDKNGRVYILLTPIVNEMTDVAQCSQSYVTGFFYPLDIYPTAVKDNRSNQAEIFYAIVPDPSGSVTCDHSVERVTRIVPVTFIHELQHMISFHQHVILRGGSSEETWLNEGMSHMAEELAALHFDGLGQQDRFNAFALGDLYNAFKYLRDPGAHHLLYSEGTGTLEERGATWLFLRWLVDQYGDDVLRRLSETGRTGSENIESATGEPVADLLSDWFLANWVTGEADRLDVPDRLDYVTWDFVDLFGQFYSHDPDLFKVPFPLVPEVFSNGSFNVTGTLRAGSGAYYRVIQLPGESGFTVELVDESGDPLGGNAEPRLNVIRIQ